MSTIVIKTQEELNALPDSFEEYTIIEIRSEKNIKIIIDKKYKNSSVVAWENSSVEAWENSSVVAWGNSSVVARGNSSVVARENSSVVAWGNSSVVAWENSQIELFIAAYCIVLSSKVVIKKLLDFSTVVFRSVAQKVLEKSETSVVREIPSNIEISFEEWLRRGYVVADGINKKLKSQKTIKDVTIFEVEDFPKRTISFVAKRGSLFSHGETIEKAIDDLRYKISDRDTSKFEYWKKDLNQIVKLEDAIVGYRIITGACEFGVKSFVESMQSIPEIITPRVILDITSNSFGNNELKKFLGV